MITTRTAQLSQLIKGPAGKLEVIVEEPTVTPKRILGVVCHPHSLYGGSMSNKVVTTLVKTFQNLGLVAVRFNFRGVGQSEGSFAEGKGEIEDLLAVIKWMQSIRPFDEVWLAGFSFGAYVAAKATATLNVNKLALVAPPVVHFPMQDISSFACPWVLIQGDLDEVVDPQAVYAWANKCNPAPSVISFKEAGHYFHGLLLDLREKLQEVLK